MTIFYPEIQPCYDFMIFSENLFRKIGSIHILWEYPVIENNSRNILKSDLNEVIEIDQNFMTAII